MEFDFSINTLLEEEITCITRDLTPCRTSPWNIREYRAQLIQVIDKMGEASSKAQGLNSVITTAQRLQLSDNRMYIMKDAANDSEKGTVVGFIRMGHKRLFIYDQHGNNHEMEPLCTLDFYIHESRQRMGCGRKLFDFMLEAEGVKPHQQAIDRPSHKFLAFLQKHYKLKATVPQVNKFVVFDGFFRDKPANAIVDKRKSLSHKPPLHPYKQPAGLIRQLDQVTGGQMTNNTTEQKSVESQITTEAWKEALSNVTIQRQNSRESLRAGSADRLNSLVSGGRMSPLAMGAQGSMYSRHINSTPASPQLNGTSRKMDSSIPTIDTNKRVIGGLDPPLHRRDGPPSDYQKLYSPDLYNSQYLDRRGNLRVEQTMDTTLGRTNQKAHSTPSIVMDTKLPVADPYSTKPVVPRTLGSGWNVFGVPPNPRAGGFPYTQTRLW